MDVRLLLKRCCLNLLNLDSTRKPGTQDSYQEIQESRNLIRTSKIFLGFWQKIQDFAGSQTLGTLRQTTYSPFFLNIEAFRNIRLSFSS